MIEWIKGLDAALGIISFFGTTALAVYVWLTRGTRANSKRIDRLEANDSSLFQRLEKMEGQMGNLPTKDDFHALDLKLSDMGGGIAALSARLEAVDHRSKSMDAYLRGNGGNT